MRHCNAPPAGPTRSCPCRSRVSAVGSRYIDWLVPGLLGMNIMGTGLWGVGFSIVQARTKKLLKRLVATPMSKAHYLLANILSRLLYLALETSVIMGFAWIAFDVRIYGSLWALGALALFGALAFGGLGLLLASRARTIEAVSGLMNLVMLPMWVLSGIFFASTNFPDAMQPFIHALPLTALIDGLRGVVNEGRSLAELAPRARRHDRLGHRLLRPRAEVVPMAVNQSAYGAYSAYVPDGASANGAPLRHLWHRWHALALVARTLGTVRTVTHSCFI